VVRNAHAVEIAQPPAAVFPYLTQPELLLRWVGGLREFEPLNGGEARVGSRSRQTMRIAGRDWRFEGEIMELERDRRIAACIRGRGLEMTSTYVLEPTEAGTRLSVDVTTAFARVFVRVLAGIVEREGQRKLETDLGRLAGLVEAATAPAS
jgi:uncharacterized protein YndB with AHSA1/START domain